MTIAKEAEEYIKECFKEKRKIEIIWSLPIRKEIQEYRVKGC